MIGRERFIKTIVDKGEEIVVYERPESLVEGSFIMELKLYTMKRGWSLIWHYPSCVSYSRLIVL